jgi:REP element-mobilizing transposase RayT
MGAYTKLTYHVIFGTKYRKPLIAEQYCERLYEYMGGTIRGLNGHLIAVGGVEDHVHLLANLSPTVALADAIRDVKANPSRWVNESAEVPTRFEWQKGYAAFTVSYSQVGSVRHYIEHQREHHRARTFEAEYVVFLQRHDIAFDHRYLFEAEHYG